MSWIPQSHTLAVRCCFVALLLARPSVRPLAGRFCTLCTPFLPRENQFRPQASVARRRAATPRDATSYIFITGLPDAVFAMRPLQPRIHLQGADSGRGR